MLGSRHVTICIAAVLALTVDALAPASAQTVPGCTPREAANPPRTVFECAGGLVIEAEAAAKLAAGSSGNASRALELEGGAALIELPPGGKRSFQIRTPHAIASVRGTVYAVDVSPDKTAVFVVKGRVRVTRRSSRRGVTLTAGKGTEVAPGQRLVAQQWSQSRVAALLARFGR